MEKGGGDIVVMKKDLVVVVLVTFCLTATLFLTIPIRSSPAEREYDPWADLDDDGKIGITDLYKVAAIFGTTGEPIDKTALLLELQTRVDILEASMLTCSSTNSSESDITFDTDYREMLGMSLNITLTSRSRLLMMFSAVVGVYFPNDVIIVRALVNESIADIGEIVFFPQIGEAEGHRHWLGFTPYTFNFLQLSDPGFYNIKIEWKVSEGGGGCAEERTLTVIALPA